MSSKLALKQLISLQSVGKPGKEIKKAIKKRKQQRKNLQARQQQQHEKQQFTYQQNLEYFKATQRAQKEASELMLKLLGKPTNEEEDSDFDTDI